MKQFLLEKMIDLVKKGKLDVEIIKNEEYKVEVKARLIKAINDSEV